MISWFGNIAMVISVIIKNITPFKFMEIYICPECLHVLHFILLYPTYINRRYPSHGCVNQGSLLWRHNGCVSNHQPHDCLLNRLFRIRSKKTSKLHVIGLCVWNSPATGEFPAQMAGNAENVFMWWRHHDNSPTITVNMASESPPAYAIFIVPLSPGPSVNPITGRNVFIKVKEFLF